MVAFPPLECSLIVFRAVPFANNLRKSDRSIRWQAFNRLDKDDDGVTVRFSIEDAIKDLKDIPGVMSIHVGKIRDIVVDEVRLDVIQNADDHAYIDGIPLESHYTNIDDKLRARKLKTDLCTAIAEKAARLISDT